MKRARKDLAHVRAAIVMFEPPRLGKQPAYMNVNGLFRRREVSQMCKEAIAENGPMTTRELAAWVIRHKGLDDSDRYLKTAVAFRIVQALRLQEKRNSGFVRVGKRANVVIWDWQPELQISARGAGT